MRRNRDFSYLKNTNSLRGSIKRFQRARVKQSGMAALILVIALASSMSAVVYSFIEQNGPYLYVKQAKEQKERSIQAALICRESIFGFFLENPQFDELYNLHIQTSKSSAAIGSLASSSGFPFSYEQDELGISCKVLSLNTYIRYGIGNEPTLPTTVERSLEMLIEGKDARSDAITRIEVVFDIAKDPLYLADERSRSDAHAMRSGLIINIDTREVN